MHENFKFYFVAYIDILGFSKMVDSDIKKPDNVDLFLTKLFKVYNSTQQSFGNHQNLQLIQFSDSVVFAMPFKDDNFTDFLKIVGQFQYNLFSQGLLCRGGISFGKHFYKNGFLFSSGLIEAYSIERELSRYPRIAISKNLLDLLYPSGIWPNCQILKENDEIYFVDFLLNHDLKDSAECLKRIIIDNSSNDASINEKHRWLCEYFDHKVQIMQADVEKFSLPRFLE